MVISLYLLSVYCWLGRMLNVLFRLFYLISVIACERVRENRRRRVGVWGVGGCCSEVFGVYFFVFILIGLFLGGFELGFGLEVIF